MDIIQVVLQGILILAYAAGVLIVINSKKETIKVLNEKVSCLQSQLSSQSTLIGDMKAVVDTFRVPIELHDKIVDMVREKSELERSEAIEEFKAKANKGITVLLHEMGELFGLSLDLVYHFSSDPRVEQYLNKMADDTMTKPKLIAEMKESRGWWESMRAAFLALSNETLEELLLGKKAKE